MQLKLTREEEIKLKKIKEELDKLNKEYRSILELAMARDLDVRQKQAEQMYRRMVRCEQQNQM